MTVNSDQLVDYTQTQYLVADASGRIQLYGNVPAFMIDYQVPPEGGCVVIGAGTPETHYVQGGAIVERPANPATLDGMTLTNLPNPCTITLEGTDHACTDATCELSFSLPGTYAVKVTAWPVLDATFEVTQA